MNQDFKTLVAQSRFYTIRPCITSRKLPKGAAEAFTGEDDPDFIHELDLCSLLLNIELAQSNVSGVKTDKKSNKTPRATNQATKIDDAVARLLDNTEEFFEFTSGKTQIFCERMEMPDDCLPIFAKYDISQLWKIDPPTLISLLHLNSDHSNSVEGNALFTRWKVIMKMKFKHQLWLEYQG